MQAFTAFILLILSNLLSTVSAQPFKITVRNTLKLSDSYCDRPVIISRRNDELIIANVVHQTTDNHSFIVITKTSLSGGGDKEISRYKVGKFMMHQLWEPVFFNLIGDKLLYLFYEYTESGNSRSVQLTGVVLDTEGKELARRKLFAHSADPKVLITEDEKEIILISRDYAPFTNASAMDASKQTMHYLFLKVEDLSKLNDWKLPVSKHFREIGKPVIVNHTIYQVLCEGILDSTKFYYSSLNTKSGKLSLEKPVNRTNGTISCSPFIYKNNIAFTGVEKDKDHHSIYLSFFQDSIETRNIKFRLDKDDVESMRVYVYDMGYWNEQTNIRSVVLRDTFFSDRSSFFIYECRGQKLLPRVSTSPVHRLYFYNDLLIMHLDSSGQFLKCALINKRQYSAISNSGFKMLAEQDTLRFFYYENTAKQGKNKDEYISEFSAGKSVISILSVPIQSAQEFYKTILNVKNLRNGQLIEWSNCRYYEGRTMIGLASSAEGYSLVSFDRIF